MQEGTNKCGGFKRAQGYERSTGEGTNEHEGSVGSLVEHRGIRTQQEQQWGLCAPCPLSPPPPPLTKFFKIFLYYLMIFTYSHVHLQLIQKTLSSCIFQFFLMVAVRLPAALRQQPKEDIVPFWAGVALVVLTTN